MRILLKNTFLDIHNTNSALETCQHFLHSDRCNCIFFVNAHCFNIAQKNPQYRKALNQGNLILNDGVGIKIAAFILNIPLKENMNGTDFIPKLLEFSQQQKQSVFLLGGKPGIAEKAQSKIQKNNPDIWFSGTHHGYFTESEVQEVISQINQSKATILIVGMGVPRQEIWLYTYSKKLHHIKIALAGGAILDFLSGNFKRAPRWIRKIGLEWFFRFSLEPKRLFTRYFIGNIIFLTTILLYKFKKIFPLKNKKIIILII